MININNNSMDMEQQVEHLKNALLPEEQNLNEKINQNNKDENSKDSQDKINNRENKDFNLYGNNEHFNKNEVAKLNKNLPNNYKEKLSKKFKTKVDELQQFIERSKNKEIEIVKIDHSKSRSKSNDKSNDKAKERDYPPLSQKYKKTNMKAAFGKLLNEKNLISELRKNFLKSLTKLNDHDTKEIAFSELRELISNYCTSDALRIYLNSLSTNYSTCTLAAKEIQAVLIGYIATVFQKNLLDCLDKPPSILKTVARMCDILLNYLRVKIILFFI